MKERRVAIYARVSTEHEAQLSALENQVQYYDNILNQHPEWKLYGRYIDEGITGTSTKKRKHFMQMMEDAEKGCFDLIITREVSRFARNTVDTLQETRRLKKMGVEVWFTEDNIWTMNDEDGELRLTIMATLAQNESKKTSLRVHAGQMVSFKNAVPYGNGNILGYDKLPNHGGYVINNEQAETVKMIFDLYLNDNGVRDIQFALEKAHRLTATGNENWHCAVISKILRNPFYCGTVVYRKQYVPDYLEQKKINNHGDVEQIVVEGKHEPIISKSDFAEVQRRLDNKVKIINDRRVAVGVPESVWSKKLECECGAHFNKGRWNRAGKNGKDSFAFQCYSQKIKGTVATRKKKGLPTEGMCEVPMMQEWKLYLMARYIFELFIEDRASIINIANELLETNIASELIDDRQRELEFYKEKFDKLKEKNDRLMEMRLEKEISRETFLEKSKDLEDRMQKTKSKIDELCENLNVEYTDVNDKLKVLAFALEQDFDFDKYNVPNSIIDAFVRKIVVHKDYCEWHLNFFDEKGIKCVVNGRKNNNPDVNILDLPSTLNCSTGRYC